MTTIHRNALVARPPAVLYALVNDVAAYPRRFDWCTGSAVLEHSEHHMMARLDLRIAGIPASVTTRNSLTPVERIELALVDGPFQHFGGVWTFDALGDAGCRVGLRLDFEMAGKLLGSALALGFAGLADRMVDDFCAVANSEAVRAG